MHRRERELDAAWIDAERSSTYRSYRCAVVEFLQKSIEDVIAHSKKVEEGLRSLLVAKDMELYDLARQSTEALQAKDVELLAKQVGLQALRAHLADAQADNQILKDTHARELARQQHTLTSIALEDAHMATLENSRLMTESAALSGRALCLEGFQAARLHWHGNQLHRHAAHNDRAMEQFKVDIAGAIDRPASEVVPLPVLWPGGQPPRPTSSAMYSAIPSRLHLAPCVLHAMETIDKATHSAIREGLAIAIRDPTEWREVWKRHTANKSPAPPVPDVNFEESMVICVFSGTKPSGGHSVEIKRVDGDGKVYYETTSPKGGMVTPAPTQPFHIVRVPKILAELEFVARLAASEATPWSMGMQ